MSDLQQHRKTGEFPRRFVAQDADLGSWETIEGYFEKLREWDLPDAKAADEWLQALSELQASIAEENTIRYIEMTCHTDDPEREKAFLFYVQEIMPKAEPHFFELSKKYLDSRGRHGLPADRYKVYDRWRQNEVEIFREENVPLNTEDEVLGQQYQKLFGEMMVEFDGQEQTLPQMARYLEETDRAVRHKAWLGTSSRIFRDHEKIDDLFDQMLALRQKMAENAGLPNFLEYQFRRLGRFDYTPADCRAFHNAVEKVVMPLRRQLREERRQQLNLPKLAPWDLEVDPLGRPPLRPFQTAEQLINGTDRIFAAVSPVFSEEFHILRDKELLDLESRKGKAPGGYQSDLDEARLPFIFMNAAGRNKDVFTLLHEGGHAFHALLARKDPLHAYRHSPIEFAEVASMGMEMMAIQHLDAFYDPDAADRAKRMHLEDVIILLPWIARIDAFQHWLYTHPGHTRDERIAEWMRLEERFGDDLDWSEMPDWRQYGWMRQLHLFTVPLYYIEYGIAQLGALQLWVKFLENPGKAVDGYRAGLSLGGSRPLPDLFEAAGIKFSFDEATVAPLAEKAQKALQG